MPQKNARLPAAVRAQPTSVQPVRARPFAVVQAEAAQPAPAVDFTFATLDAAPPPRLRLLGDSAVMQREIDLDDAEPDRLLADVTDIEILRLYAAKNRCWPQGRSLKDWIDFLELGVGSAVGDEWKKFSEATTIQPAFTALKNTVEELKKHIEKVYEVELTYKEKKQKAKNITILAAAFPPELLGMRAGKKAHDPEEYANKLFEKAKSVSSLIRYLRVTEPPNLKKADAEDSENRQLIVSEIRRLKKLPTERKIDRSLPGYLQPLSNKEMERKVDAIEDLVKVYQPSDLGANDLPSYKNKLTEKVLGNPRFLESIKGTESPRERREQDDDPEVNKKMIEQACDKLRGDSSFWTAYKPGKALNWDKWRKDDCVFAAIIAALLDGQAPTDEVEDQEKAEKVADALDIARGGPVNDPVTLALMEKLAWPYQPNLTWTKFQATADAKKVYVLSYDTSAEGSKAHVVIARYKSDAWTIYDRQAKRLSPLKKDVPTPQYPDNPLDAWQVDAKSTKAAELKQTLS